MCEPFVLFATNVYIWELMEIVFFLHVTVQV